MFNPQSASTMAACVSEAILGITLEMVGSWAAHRSETLNLIPAPGAWLSMASASWSTITQDRIAPQMAASGPMVGWCKCLPKIPPLDSRHGNRPAIPLLPNRPGVIEHQCYRSEANGVVVRRRRPGRRPGGLLGVDQNHDLAAR